MTATFLRDYYSNGTSQLRMVIRGDTPTETTMLREVAPLFGLTFDSSSDEAVVVAKETP